VFQRGDLTVLLLEFDQAAFGHIAELLGRCDVLLQRIGAACGLACGATENLRQSFRRARRDSYSYSVNLDELTVEQVMAAVDEALASLYSG
jgi:hypothetical protein